MSEILPMGKSSAEAASRYAVATQLNARAFNDRSFPMEGSAIFTEDNRNGVRNELIVEASSATCLFVLVDASVSIPVPVRYREKRS